MTNTFNKADNQTFNLIAKKDFVSNININHNVTQLNNNKMHFFFCFSILISTSLNRYSYFRLIKIKAHTHAPVLALQNAGREPEFKGVR